MQLLIYLTCATITFLTIYTWHRLTQAATWEDK